MLSFTVWTDPQRLYKVIAGMMNDLAFYFYIIIFLKKDIISLCYELTSIYGLQGYFS